MRPKILERLEAKRRNKEIAESKRKKRKTSEKNDREHLTLMVFAILILFLCFVVCTILWLLFI